jgi:hypothetical protein
MFAGIKAGKGKAGGKGGKGKTGGKGGINVIVKEDRGSDDDDDDPDSDRELGGGRLAVSRMTAAAVQSPQQRKRGDLSPGRFSAPAVPPAKIGRLTPTASATWGAVVPTGTPAEEKLLSPSLVQRGGGGGQSGHNPLSDMESGGERTDGSSSSSARRRRHDNKRKLDQKGDDTVPSAPVSRIPAVTSGSPLDTGRGTVPFVGVSPVAAAPASPPPAASVTYRADGRPSLVFSMPLSRVSRAGAVHLSNFRGQQHRQQPPGGVAVRPAARDKKGGGKELWFTRPPSSSGTGPSNEPAGRSVKKRSGTVIDSAVAAQTPQYPRNSLSDRTSVESVVPVINVSERLVSPLRALERGGGRPPSALRERRDSCGSSRSSSSSSHRKQVERTHSPLEEDLVVSGGESFLSESAAAAQGEDEEPSGGGVLYERKRCRRQSPPLLEAGGSAAAAAKRFRSEEEGGGEGRWPLGGPSCAHPTFLPSTPELGGLMPPPTSTVPVYYSYFER